MGLQSLGRAKSTTRSMTYFHAKVLGWGQPGSLLTCGWTGTAGGRDQGLIMKCLSVFAKETLFFDSGQLEGDFLL